MTDLRPVVGSDRNTWGTKLLTWLGGSVDVDGTLKSAAVKTALGGSIPGTGWFSVKDTTYGAKGDGSTDDTAAIQAAINAAIAYAAGGGSGGTVFFPPGVYVISAALTYLTGITLRGSGRYTTVIVQKAGTADVFIKSQAVGSTQKSVCIQDLALDAKDFIDNTAANRGGVDFEGTTTSRIERVRFVSCNNFAARIKGGATQGDAMYNTITGCLIVNIPSGSYGVQLSVSTQVTGGSHPDGTRIIENHVNCTGTGTAFRIDPAAADTAGYLSADSAIIAFNTTIECPTVIDICSQRTKVIANRFEHTSGTLTILVNNTTPTNCPSIDNVFIANSYATHGSYASLVFTDNGVRTQQIAEPGYEVTTTNGVATYKTNESAFVVPTFGGSGAAVTINSSLGGHFRVVVTDTTAFTISNPGMTVPGKRITIMVKNSSGGSMGAITWDTNYRLAGSFTNPANGKRRTITFYYDSTDGVWLEESRAAADI